LCSHKVSSQREEIDKKLCELSNYVISNSLLDFVRKAGFKGAKGGCREGGCGACTILLTYIDSTTKKAQHKVVTSCLTPLPKIDGMVGTTVEGIGLVSSKLHPLQNAIIKTRRT
jgi:xanthine dehydrogenase/oxidase